MMKRRGWDVEAYVEDIRRIDFDVVAGSDLVGISTIPYPDLSLLKPRSPTPEIPDSHPGPDVVGLPLRLP